MTDQPSTDQPATDLDAATERPELDPGPDEIPDQLVTTASDAWNAAPQKRDGRPTRMRHALAAAWPEIRRRVRAETLRDLDAGTVSAQDLAAAGLDPGHVVDLRNDGWTIQHPLTCGTDLFACPVNRAAERDLTGRPRRSGQFECGVKDGEFWIGEAR